MRILTTISLICFSIFAVAQTEISGIINDYTSVSEYTCENAILVDDESAFSPGDIILIVQMKGAEIETSNSSSFGDILSYGSTGKYELNEVLSVAPGEIQLLNVLENDYNYSGLVQAVRVPVYESAIVTDTLTCASWNGSTGGILAMVVEGTLTFEAWIDVSGKGFNGGEQNNYPDSCPIGLSWNGYRTSTTSGNGATKGEGIASVGDSQRAGRGKLANGGGGGNDHNAGGGGGSLGAEGGTGGERIESYFSCPGPGKGQGGAVPDHSNIENRIYLGGGGGCGHGNNGNGSAGGNGGGIALIRANIIDGNGMTIAADGLSSADANGDGAGGGGSGGSVLLDIASVDDEFQISLTGGDGGNVFGIACTGPGGGGSGGVLRHTTPSLPMGIFVDASGGNAGTTLTEASDCFEDSNGAGNGAGGIVIEDFPLLIADTEWSSDFASATSDTSLCEGSSITLTASGGLTYSWSPDTGLDDATSDSPVCSALETTTYTVTATSAAGCTDTASVTVNVAEAIEAIAGPDTSICGPGQVFFFAEGGSTYNWTPDDGVSDTEIADPIVFVTTTTDYVVTIGNGVCSVTDTVSVEVLDLPELTTNSDTTLCAGQPIILSVSGASAYSWEPAAAVPCVDCSFMEFIPGSTTTYTVIGTNADNCSNSASFTVTVEVCNDIEQYNLNSLPLIYPNPVSKQLQIEFTETIGSPLQIELYNIKGNLVYSSVTSNRIHIIDVQEFSGGEYILRIGSGMQVPIMVIE